jgi:hypothetical protein
MAQDKSGTKAMPQQAQEQVKDKAGTATDTKTSGAMNNDSKSKASESGAAAGTAKPTTADSKTGGDTKSTTTTGNAATSATAAPPAEKQTQIVSAIKQEKVEEVTNVNFNISIGARVPATVHYRPLPSKAEVDRAIRPRGRSRAALFLSCVCGDRRYLFLARNPKRRAALRIVTSIIPRRPREPQTFPRSLNGCTAHVVRGTRAVAARTGGSPDL